MDRVRFLFDECISHRLATYITDVGRKHPLQISAESLRTANALQTHDISWVEKHLKPGIVAVSKDCRMISDHDIASVVRATGGKMFLLRPDVSQRRQWQLLKWCLDHLPKLAITAQGAMPGTTWLVNKDGLVCVVEPSKPLLTIEEAPEMEAAGTA